MRTRQGMTREERPMWGEFLRGTSQLHVMVFVFVFLGDSHDGSKQLPCTDQFPSHHRMHRRRSRPNTSTFLNMKEISPKPLLLVLEVLIMQS